MQPSNVCTISWSSLSNGGQLSFRIKANCGWLFRIFQSSFNFLCLLMMQMSANVIFSAFICFNGYLSFSFSSSLICVVFKVLLFFLLLFCQCLTWFIDSLMCAYMFWPLVHVLLFLYWCAKNTSDHKTTNWVCVCVFFFFFW